jgi:glycosyltransferase involved in cell wall biosynthesis
MTDYNAGFGSSTTELAALEQELARRADIVAITASELLPRAQSMAPNKEIVHLPHGVDLEHFARSGPAPADIEPVPRPIVVYVGSIREWFDFELVSWLSEELPELSFVIIGPERAARGKLPERPNIHLLGERHYSTIPHYLAAADVGIIPFDRVRYPSLVDHANPLKLYEYMAAGLPVVSTDWPVLRRLASPALLSGSAEEFRANLLTAIADAASLGPAGRQFANEHGWEASYQTLLSATAPLLRARRG